MPKTKGIDSVSCEVCGKIYPKEQIIAKAKKLMKERQEGEKRNGV